MRERVRLKKSQKTPKDIDGVFIRAHIRRDNIIQKLRHSFGFLTDISRLGRHGLMLTANSSKNNEPTREKISRFAISLGDYNSTVLLAKSPERHKLVHKVAGISLCIKNPKNHSVRVIDNMPFRKFSITPTWAS
jgi:hypothetical protein